LAALSNASRNARTSTVPLASSPRSPVTTSSMGMPWRSSTSCATSVTAEAHAAKEERPGETLPSPPRRSRFGPVFGETVHRAIGHALRDPVLAPAAAVARAARATGLAERQGDAAADVGRALAALARAGLRRTPGPDLRLEYPIAIARGGALLSGYLDLVGAAGGGLAVVDFKTDAPPGPDLSGHAAYVEQVRSYARILEELGLAAAGTVRAGLLFTAEEEIRWVDRPAG